MMRSLVSVIITTKNEESVLERLLKSLNSQTYRKIEIIVVDNSSVDKTKKISLRYTPRVYDKGPERSAQRNFGAKKAKGNFLLFLDADMKLTSRVIEKCVDVVTKSKGVGAIIIPEESIANTYWEKVKAFERSFYNEEGDEVTDAARFFTKKAFRQVNGYDESITGPEDWDLPESVKKRGYKIGRIRAKIYHYERVPNPFRLAKKKYYYGLKAYQYMTKHNVFPISAKTIYFIRPVFYKNWRKLFSHPILSVAMFFMLIMEQLGGGVGYFIGRLTK